MGHQAYFSSLVITCNMKIIATLLVIALLVFLAIQLFGMYSQKGIETYPYTVVKEYDGFEVRQYESALFSSVQLGDKGYKKNSGRGFSILAGYIFGGNENQEKIAMTSPVSMSLDEEMTMMFMVPSKYSIEDLPKPKDEKIEFKQVPARKMAAITFGGWANDEKIESYRQKLTRLLDREGIQHSGHYHYYGYNAPYEVINRKNEVVIEL